MVSILSHGQKKYEMSEADRDLLQNQLKRLTEEYEQGLLQFIICILYIYIYIYMYRLCHGTSAISDICAQSPRA